MKIAVVLITYNRVRDAKSLMYSIRNQWIENKNLSDVTIYHVFNGKSEWYPTESLEDVLIRTHNDGHMTGASHMIDSGIEAVLQSKKSYDVILVCSADVFFTSSDRLAQILALMDQGSSTLATSVWFHPRAFATEFFLIRPVLARLIFPLSLKAYLYTHPFAAMRTLLFPAWPVLEELLFQKSRVALREIDPYHWKRQILLIPGRMYVFVHNRFVSPSIGYSSFHRQSKKVETLSSIADPIQREDLLAFWK